MDSSSWNHNTSWKSRKQSSYWHKGNKEGYEQGYEQYGEEQGQSTSAGFDNRMQDDYYPQRKKYKGNFNPIPERWEEYKPVGKRIYGTRFICFKVPLKKVMCILDEI